MIKAITFDLDGVYFTGESFKRFKASLPKKVSDETQVNWVLYKCPQILAFKSGKLSEEEYWQFAKDSLGIEIGNEEIFKLLRDSYEVNSEVHEYLLSVRTRGFKTCICSNNFVTRVRELDAKFGFLKHFDVPVFSYEAGVMKPDKRIYERLVELSGVRPKEIIYSDDTPEALSGAHEVGINAFLFEGFERFKEKVENLIENSS